jgi:small-conductance mechanosensitive channel
MDISDFFSSISAAVQKAKVTLSWMPDWLVAPALILAALILALIVHSLVVAIARRVVSPRRVFLKLLLSQTKGPTRLGLVILALTAAARVAPFDPEVNATLSQGLAVAFVVLLGWIAIIAIDLAASVYLQRFRLDIPDNLLARKHVTQVRVLKGAVNTLAVVLTVALALMTFEPVRQYGLSLFASAGVAGIVAGLAARPLLSNLIAGVQIAMTQPIRIEDAVTVEGEFGWVEEITATYVVLRLWDLRRMIVPLSYFMEKPFQNWTRQTSELIGSVFLYLDYSAPVDHLREKLQEIVKSSKLWDGRVANLQVTDAKSSTIEVRALVSAGGVGAASDLRNEVREKLILFLQQEHPGALPRQRTDIALPEEAVAAIARGIPRATSQQPTESTAPRPGNGR